MEHCTILKGMSTTTQQPQRVLKRLTKAEIARRVVEAFLHAYELPGKALGMARMLTLPGITASIGQMVDALAAT